jgi:hypothetical protein
MNRLISKSLVAAQSGFDTLRNQFDQHPVLAPFLGGVAVGAALIGFEFATDAAMTTFLLHETGVLPAVPESPVIN